MSSIVLVLAWAEAVDVDDDGVVEDNQFLYDAKRGMLFAYREDDFGCANGGTANGSILEALYAQGNPAGKPVGRLVRRQSGRGEVRRQALGRIRLQV
jgi:hypothetical protein